VLSLLTMDRDTAHSRRCCTRGEGGHKGEKEKRRGHTSVLVFFSFYFSLGVVPRLCTEAAII
jgi:hypothetical protein